MSVQLRSGRQLITDKHADMVQAIGDALKDVRRFGAGMTSEDLTLAFRQVMEARTTLDELERELSATAAGNL